MATTNKPGRSALALQLREQGIPIAVVVLLILIGWYGLTVALNAQGAIERDLADRTWDWRGLVAATMAMQRPVLPAPHQVLFDLWNSLTGRPLDSPRNLLYHAAVTAQSTLVGFVLGHLGAAVIRHLYPTFPAYPPEWAVLAGLATALVTGILFGVLPARRAARLDPVQALAKH